MQIVSTINALREQRAALDGTVGFVPTMGALHAGHMALVSAARSRCKHVIASIFVNPLQFAAGEDLDAYPAPRDEDIRLLREAGVALVFTPTPAVLYPKGFATSVVTQGMDDMLCGLHRPGHFDGVTTVVALLFALVRPDIVFFGEKDYQQCAIVSRMNRDLHLVRELAIVPTVREADGLALSSRNRYLSAEERTLAPRMHAVMQDIRAQQDVGLNKACDAAKATLLHSGFTRVDYLEARDAVTLEPTNAREGARLFAAAHIGRTRLIDNIALD